MHSSKASIRSRTLAGAAALAIGCITSGTAFGQDMGSNNPYSPAHGHPYRHGVVPTREAWQHMKEYADHNARPGGGGSGKTLSYGGGVDGIGVTSGSPKVYLVVWGTQWGSQSGNSFSGDSAGAVPRLINMFSGLGTGGELWSGVMTQYCDGAVSAGATSCPSGSSHVGYPSGAYAGIWYDNSAAAPSNATANQIGTEAVRAAAHFGNTTPASNRYVQYVILSPSGTHPDGFNTPQGTFCAWHDWNGDPYVGVSSPYGDIAFTNMPYVLDLGASCGQNFVNAGSAGTLDGFTIVEGHEYSETITDQNPAGGWTSASSGQENADECSWISSGQGASANVVMGNGTYAMQSTWSNDTNQCDIAHAIVTNGGGGGGGPTANFSYVANGTTVQFTDTSTDTSATITAHAWTFGDGGTSTATNPSHAYAKPGTFSVSEKVTDSNGATSTKTASVKVAKH